MEQALENILPDMKYMTKMLHPSSLALHTQIGSSIGSVIPQLILPSGDPITHIKVSGMALNPVASNVVAPLGKNMLMNNVPKVSIWHEPPRPLGPEVRNKHPSQSG